MTAVIPASESPATPGPLLEHLGLHQAAAVLPSWLDRAAAQELSYGDFLHGLLNDPTLARITLPTGEVLTADPNFKVIATMNGEYEDLRPSLQDRFSIAVDGEGILTIDTGKITLGPLPVALGQPGIIPPRTPTGCI